MSRVHDVAALPSFPSIDISLLVSKRPRIEIVIPMPASLANFSGLGVQKKPLGIQRASVAEVKHAFDATRENIERAAANPLSLKPVVFNKTDDGSLVSLRMIDVILFGPGRDDEQRQART